MTNRDLLGLESRGDFLGRLESDELEKVRGLGFGLVLLTLGLRLGQRGEGEGEGEDVEVVFFAKKTVICRC